MAIVAAFITCVLIWGSTWYAIELQLGVVPKEWSLAYRFGLAAITLFIVCGVKKKRVWIEGRAHLWAIGTGFFFFSANYFMVYNGSVYLTSGLVAVAFSLLSFFNIINGRIFLGNAIETKTSLAALMGVAGLLFIFQPEVTSLDIGDNTVIGIGFCLAATMLASVGNTIAGSKTVKSLPLFAFNAWGLLYGTLFNILFALLAGASPAFDLSASYVGSLLYLAIPGTVITFTIYLWLVDRIGIVKGGYIAVLTPLVALTLSTFLEGFQWTSSAILGLGLVVAGNILMVRSRVRKV